MNRAKSPRKKRNSFPVSLTIAVAFLYGILAGVTGALHAAEAKAAPVPAAAQVKVAPVPAAVAQTYHYSPVKKPDPFRSFLDREAAEQKKKAAKLTPIPQSPLQRADVDQYKLRGIAGDEGRRSAIVEDANGRFYPLFRGTVVGKNNGKVVEILPDRVIVEEKVRTRAGQSQVKRITMKLHRES